MLFSRGNSGRTVASRHRVRLQSICLSRCVESDFSASRRFSLEVSPSAVHDGQTLHYRGFSKPNIAPCECAKPKHALVQVGHNSRQDLPPRDDAQHHHGKHGRLVRSRTTLRNVFEQPLLERVTKRWPRQPNASDERQGGREDPSDLRGLAGCPSSLGGARRGAKTQDGKPKPFKKHIASSSLLNGPMRRQGGGSIMKPAPFPLLQPTPMGVEDLLRRHGHS